MERICGDCKIRQTCPVKKPASYDVAFLRDSTLCVHYTCMLDGMLAARRAHKNGCFETVTMINGKRVEAARFGTRSKPTQYPDGEFQRLVDKDGYIITRNENKEFVYSGQQTGSRFLVSPNLLLKRREG